MPVQTRKWELIAFISSRLTPQPQRGNKALKNKLLAKARVRPVVNLLATKALALC